MSGAGAPRVGELKYILQGPSEALRGMPSIDQDYVDLINNLKAKILHGEPYDFKEYQAFSYTARRGLLGECLDAQVILGGYTINGYVLYHRLDDFKGLVMSHWQAKKAMIAKHERDKKALEKRTIVQTGLIDHLIAGSVGPDVQCPCHDPTLALWRPSSLHIDWKENNAKRFETYRMITSYLHGYLGAKKRIELPACCVAEVQRLYPKADGEEYVGFRAQSAEDEAGGSKRSRQ